MDYPKTLNDVDLYNGKFTDGDPLNNIPASRDPAIHTNAITDELLNVIKLGGLLPKENELDQVVRAIKAIIKEQTDKLSSTGLGVGGVIIWPYPNVPTDFLVVPTAATNLSRTSYPLLHEVVKAQGYPWGSGDGATTFGTFWLGPDRTVLQANGNLATTTPGQVLRHLHTFDAQSGEEDSRGGGNRYGTQTGNTISTSEAGGDANIAAGTRVLFIQRYK